MVFIVNVHMHAGAWPVHHTHWEVPHATSILKEREGARKRGTPLSSLIHFSCWKVGPVRHPCTIAGTKQRCGLCTNVNAATFSKREMKGFFKNA
jgi:hypothetical protein